MNEAVLTMVNLFMLSLTIEVIIMKLYRKSRMMISAIVAFNLGWAMYYIFGVEGVAITQMIGMCCMMIYVVIRRDNKDVGFV